jgi:hypothetical protein
VTAWKVLSGWIRDAEAIAEKLNRCCNLKCFYETKLLKKANNQTGKSYQSAPCVKQVIGLQRGYWSPIIADKQGAFLVENPRGTPYTNILTKSERVRAS